MHGGHFAIHSHGGVLVDSATDQKYARGIVRQSFNGVPGIVRVTDADLAATLVVPWTFVHFALKMRRKIGELKTEIAPLAMMMKDVLWCQG